MLLKGESIYHLVKDVANELHAREHALSMTEEHLNAFSQLSVLI